MALVSWLGGRDGELGPTGIGGGEKMGPFLGRLGRAGPLSCFDHHE